MTTTSDARTAFTMLPPEPTRPSPGPGPATPPRTPGPRRRALQLLDHPKFRAARAGVFQDLLALRADRLLRHDPQSSSRRLLLEGPLHQTVFQRVEGDHGAP